MKIIRLDYNEYPEKLRAIKNQPKQLYILGNKKLLQNECVGIIGSRNCSYYGEKMAQQFAEELSSNNITIVSGLAIGIDTYAHIGAMREKGKTIAVLGGGFNNLFPKENKKLFENIIENGGCVITEYEPDIFCNKFTFPQRNRIVAGLSKCILVIEAKEKSGALITAQIAKEQNKKVFCIPSNLTNECSRGSNMLIKNGASITLDSDNILKEFKQNEQVLSFKNKKAKKKIEIKDKLQKEIYNFLSDEPVNIEEINLKVKLDIKEINFALTILEMEGHIKKLAGNKFVRR